mmetsp:Transcript_2410/g.6213  ORF Transcript_2410/g.6213 Transcript_2410/m.6213 type:complete len:353 (-) Transcript_2410:373-1431(-)
MFGTLITFIPVFVLRLYIELLATMLRNLQFMFHGSKHFSKEAYEKASRAFDKSILERRLDGKVCVVTGANQGLGLACSELLAKCGATLYMVCRNAERGQKAVKSVQDKTGNPNVHLRLCDVSSVKSVLGLAAELDQPGSKIDVLIQNAGVLINEPQKSEDGYDLNFATNMLGPYLLTRLLEDVLKRSAPSRVIFVSSGGMLTQPLDVDVQKAPSARGYDGTALYAKDKRRQVAVVERLAELWNDAGVKVLSMHPGWATTEGVKKSIPGFYKFYQNKFRDPEQGADTIAYLALEDEKKLVPGGFYLDRAPQAKHLSMGGTQYSKSELDQLMANLDSMTSTVLKKHKDPAQQQT